MLLSMKLAQLFPRLKLPRDLLSTSGFFSRCKGYVKVVMILNGGGSIQNAFFSVRSRYNCKKILVEDTSHSVAAALQKLFAHSKSR
jgi:hypothetical protein